MHFVICCLLLLFPLSSLSPEAFGAARPQPVFTVDRDSLRQGEFLVATVSGAGSRPELRFNGERYPMFRRGEGSYRSLVPVENLTEPGRYEIVAGDGDRAQRHTVTVVSNNLPVQKIWLDEKTNSLKATEEEKKQVRQALRVMSDEQRWHGTFDYPCKGRKSSPFGVKRSYNGAPVSSYHKGIDIAVPRGTPVLAPADGKVVLTGYEANRFHVHGNTVVIDHGQGLQTIYLHLHAIDVDTGDTVKKGEAIGTVGSTGISTGPHLHWGTYLYGTSVDPELFVRKEY